MLIAKYNIFYHLPTTTQLRVPVWISERRALSPDNEYPLTSREELHDQVQVDLILERKVELHHPRIVSLH